MFQDRGTEDFFHLRLDMMLDLRSPLVVLSSHMPWQQIEASVAHLFARKVKDGKRLSDLDLFGQGIQTGSTRGGVAIGVRLGNDLK